MSTTATVEAAADHDGRMSDPAEHEESTMSAQAHEPVTEPDVDDVIETDGAAEGATEGATEGGLSGETPPKGAEVIHIGSRNGTGVLSISPDQDKFTPAQITGLRSIGVETQGEDGVPFPYVWQFLHTCQTSNLDPWLREAYLITHGKRFTKNSGEVVDNRKFTLVTGIDGFRKKAEDTGQYVGQVGPEWLDENGVWHDFWIARWGNPIAARVGILRKGFDAPVYGVAVFEEFVPMVDVYAEEEAPSRSGGTYKKRVKTGEKKPTDMWVKMPSNQIAKCAEAQGFRKAFPRTMAGLYEASEMDRARSEYDEQRAAERDRDGARRRAEARRSRAVQVVREETAVPTGEGETVPGEVVETPTSAGEPVTVGEVARDVVDAVVVEERAQDAPERAEEPAPDAQPDAPQSAPQEPAPRALSPQECARLARAEVAWQAYMLGQNVATLTQRTARALGRPYDDFTAVEVLRTAGQMRGAVVHTLTRLGRTEEAAAYKAVRPEQYVDVAEMFDDADQSEVVDPSLPHDYLDANGVCRHCRGAEDDPAHY